jgi:hypothetical protein
LPPKVSGKLARRRSKEHAREKGSVPFAVTSGEKRKGLPFWGELPGLAFCCYHSGTWADSCARKTQVLVAKVKDNSLAGERKFLTGRIAADGF